MVYYIEKLVTNDKNQISSTVEVKDNFDSAAVQYHNTLAAYHNAADVLYAVVQLQDEYGRTVGGESGYREVVDHRPQPEPETPVEE